MSYVDLTKCQSCQKVPANEEHACPFRSEINDDNESTCNCCPECAHECAMDV